MQYGRIEKGYMAYVDKEEKMMSILTRFCAANDILSAQLSGIGAVKSIDIGAYDIEKKKNTSGINCRMSGNWSAARAM